MSDTYRINEAAQKLGIARCTLDRWIQRGDVTPPLLHIRGTKRIPKWWVDEFATTGQPPPFVPIELTVGVIEGKVGPGLGCTPSPTRPG